MDCKHANEHLVEYLYQELDADEADRIEGHLRQCEGCADELASFEATRRLAQQLPLLEPPTSVTERLLQEARRSVEPAAPGLWQRLQSGLSLLVLHPAMTAAVAVVLVLGVSFYAFQQSTPPARDGRVGLPAPEKIGLPAPAGQPAEEPVVAPGGSAAQAKAGADGDETGRRAQREVVVDQPVASPPVATTRSAGGGKLAGKRRARRPARRKPRARPRPRKAPSAPKMDSLSNAYGDVKDKGLLAGEEELKASKAEARKKVDSASWLARARKANKSGRCGEALRLYHRALENDPGLRRTVGPEIRRCARILAARGGGSLEKAQQELPLLAGWLEAELSIARRKAARKANPPAKYQKVKAKPVPQRRSTSIPSAD